MIDCFIHLLCGNVRKWRHTFKGGDWHSISRMTCSLVSDVSLNLIYLGYDRLPLTMTLTSSDRMFIDLSRLKKNRSLQQYGYVWKKLLFNTLPTQQLSECALLCVIYLHVVLVLDSSPFANGSANPKKICKYWLNFDFHNLWQTC